MSVVETSAGAVIGASSHHPASFLSERVETDGKHLQVSGLPFRVRGVTYGSFLPRLDGALFPERSQIKFDLAQMEAAGFNVVRTYTLPPEDLLDIAAEMGLRVLVGLDYRDWRYETAPGRDVAKRVLAAGRAAVAAAVERCAHRPEVLAISVGNEVPVDVVRTHGVQKVERVLTQLVEDIHVADPNMLATYCNFPTTEFLQIDRLDLMCFNVFLEQEHSFARYLRHLQTVSGELPLVITELGLASQTHGENEQASALDWQLRTVDETGCAGATIFSWTDEWAVAGNEIEDWCFGITDRARRPKAAFYVASGWALRDLRDLRLEWPRISVVVCAYNAAGLIEECLTSLNHCDYPDLEVIVCDDGSSDDTVAIAQRFPFKVLALPRGGLSAARNAGIEAATGEIVAFLDSDAFCHPSWPYHLAIALEGDDVVATGGPNLPVAGVGLVERAVAQSPGAPMEVLTDDDRAEHVPGCNMAFRKSALEEIGGFDPVFRAAGDDVDVCWKLLDRGYSISFSPAAQVRHHRRDSVRGYLRQQKGYGRAERLLQCHHQNRFNLLGQARWSGFIYGGPRVLPFLLRPVVYHGYLGAASYQSVIRRPAEIARVWGTALVPLFLLIAALTAMTAVAWAPAAYIALGTLALIAGYAAAIAMGVRLTRDEPFPVAFRSLVGALHIAQPIVRSWGRLKTSGVPAPEKAEASWTGDRIGWLKQVRDQLGGRRFRVAIAEPHQPWDLTIASGPMVKTRVAVAVTWGWTPIWAMSHRPRGTALLILGASAALASVGGWAFASALSLAACSAMLEIHLHRRAVRKTMLATTRGSQG
jgi:O-antigen biosynthesis protein